MGETPDFLRTNGHGQELPRVVVTGLGTVNPLANNVEGTWQKLIDGESGLGPITRYEDSNIGHLTVGEIQDQEALGEKLLTLYGTSKELRKCGLATQYSVLAAEEALKHSGIVLVERNQDIGVIIGTGEADLPFMYEGDRRYQSKDSTRRVPPTMISGGMPSRPGADVGRLFGLSGPTTATSLACASGTSGIIEAYKTLVLNEADVMVAGGVEAPLEPAVVGSFYNMKALTKEGISRPFDVERDGFAIAEGAGVVILETLEHAYKRGAKILAEIIGYAGTSDANKDSITAPYNDGEEMANCMKNALSWSGLDPNQIQYINAHGTSTPPNDPAEINAIREIFGEHAAEIYINSTKGAAGHLVGGAGGLEAVVVAKSIETGMLHPTLNLKNVDPKCEGVKHITDGPITAQIEYALSNSFGFGGANTTLVFANYDPSV